MFNKDPAKIKFKELDKKVSSKESNINNKFLRLIIKPIKPKKNKRVL